MPALRVSAGGEVSPPSSRPTGRQRAPGGQQFYGKRVAVWAGVLTLLVAGLFLAVSSSTVREPHIDLRVPEPLVPPAATAQPQLRAQTYSAWRMSEPITIVTEDEVFVALVEAGIPRGHARVLARAAVECEAPVKDRNDVSIGALLTANGDGGKSHGPLQIHVGHNPWAAEMALTDLDTAARAAAVIYHEGGITRWSCAR